MANKITIICFITALLLLLTLSNTVVARPFHDVTPMETPTQGTEVETVDVDQDSCRGLGEDECMMRRTLDAHIDYIYTQKHNKP